MVGTEPRLRRALASPVLDLLLLLSLILLNGLFAASEMALVSSRPARLAALAESGSAGARAAQRLADDPSIFLATVQVGITTIGILSGAFGENAIARQLVSLFDALPVIGPYSLTVATILMVLIVTYLSVVIGEIVPKRLALLAPERFAATVARPMGAFARLVSPLVRILSASSDLLLRLLRADRSGEPAVTEEEVRSVLAESAAAGVLRPEEHQAASNILRLDDLHVSTLMTPRSEIRWIDLDEPAGVARERLRTARHHTVPIARGDLDHITGMLDTQDYLAALLAGEEPSFTELAHPAMFLPESISPLQLVEELRRERSHVALIVDEYGSVEGLISVTDLLEAIVGELPGRDEDPADEAVQRADGSWLLDGRLPIERVEDLLGTTLKDGAGVGEYRTLAGFVVDRLGRIPDVGATIDAGGLHYEVVDMDGYRVDRLLVQQISPAVHRPTAPDP